MKRPRKFAILLVIAVVMTAILLGIELRRRHGLYWYEVAHDYRYSFSDQHAKSLTVDVSSEGFLFPRSEADWDTAVLRLRVEGSWTSRWFEPSIAVANGSSDVDQQFFDRGAQGDRYLVLTPDMIQPRGFVTL